MQLVFSVLTSFIVMLAMHECIRHMNKVISWTIFLVLPVLLTPYWVCINREAFGLFEWGKLYSVLVTTLLLVVVRFRQQCFEVYAVPGLKLLFGLNIVEAIAVDLANLQPGSIVNAASGFLLVAVLGKSSCRIQHSGRYSDLEFAGLSRIWILGFTLWNLAFLLANYPIILGHHLAVLGVPLVVGLYKPQLWLQARLCLLAVDLMAFASFSSFLLPLQDTSEVSELKMEMFAGATSLVVSLLVLILTLTQTELQVKKSSAGEVSIP